MWHSGTSHSRWNIEIAFEKSLPRVSVGSWIQRGFRFGNPSTCSTIVGAIVSFSFDQPGTRGVSATLLTVMLAMPSIALPYRLIISVTLPRQCPIMCRRRSGPTCSRMMSIAGG